MWPIAGAPDGSFHFDNQPLMLGPVPGQQEHGRRQHADRGGASRSADLAVETRSSSKRTSADRDRQCPP
jgi:hypothetical protein